MNTCRLRNRVFIISIILLLLVVAYSYYSKMSSESIVGGFQKPLIFANGYVYETKSIRNTSDISNEYIFYGYIESSAKEMVEVPDKDLQVTKIIEDNIGYKVYISKDKEIVAIFNEDMQKYNYYEKMN